MKPSYARALATLPLLLSNLIVPVGFFAAASLMIPTRGVLAASSDYLPADLRSRVDQLKADLTRIPTDQTNARARAELTWQWLNAFALEGGYVPVNATQVIAYTLGNPQIGQDLINALNNTISELAFLEDHPGAIGELVADVGPYPAGGIGTIQQTYTVGNRPIQTGGGLMIARHFMADFGAWQTNDPAAPNYVSIASSNPRASFVATTEPLTGMHGGFRTSRPTLVFEVASGTLSEGDTVVITYGDTRGGSPGMSMPSFSSDRMPLPLYVAFEDSGAFYSLPIQPIKIAGTTLAGVAGFAPSIVKPGETFNLAIRARDRYFNRAAAPIPNWKVLKDGQPWLEVPAKGPITITQASIIEPGAHFLSVVSADGAITGEVNPVLVSAEDREQIFWGDTHGHSGFAEGIGTPDRFMQWARDDARLDYVTHSEHDIWLDDAEWETLRENVRKYTQEGEFIAYLGYEWTVSTTRGGHHNVLFRNPAQRNRIPAQFYPTLSDLYQGLRNSTDPADVVVIPHAHQAGDYRQNDPKLEPLVEIMSQHGNFEWFGRMYLQHGHQVGFIAASDNHLSQPGYSAPLGGSLSQRGGLGAILARERTTNAIFDGMKQLKAYATTGDRIILDFEVNNTGMGQRGSFAEQRTIQGRVIGTAPIDTITVFKNDQIVWQNAYMDNTEDRLNRTDTFALSFSSASNPFHPQDNPRGWRGWEGTLEVIGATLEEIKPVDASFPLQRVERSEDNPNRFTFSTKSRGDSSSYELKLSDISRNTRLKIDLVETLETGGAPPVYRPPERIAADSFVLALKDIAQGQVVHTQRVDDYEDQARLRRIVTDGKREVEFEFTDQGNKQGDYYFVRVVQANDAIAWSSPVWIGGHNKQ